MLNVLLLVLMNIARGRDSGEKGNRTKKGSEISADERAYCLCDQISYGKMIACDNKLCPMEWFHFNCVQISAKPKGKWYCPKCRGDNLAHTNLQLHVPLDLSTEKSKEQIKKLTEEKIQLEVIVQDLRTRLDNQEGERYVEATKLEHETELLKKENKTLKIKLSERCCECTDDNTFMFE